MGEKDPITPILLLLLLLHHLPSALSATAAGEDVSALNGIGKSLTGLPKGWGSTGDACKWLGVKCSGGRVTGLDLSGNAVSGLLPDNAFAPLTALTELNLGKNHITGPFPSLSGLSSLQELVLDGNSFTALPSSLFTGLTSLNTVSLDDNPFAEWTIPDSLSDCSALTTFSATNASLTGQIPDSLGSLPALSQLRLSYNNLTGTLPASFAGSSITSLILNNQKGPRLSGNIDVIARMPQLSFLYLQSNAFTGPIPDLTNLTSLTTFNVRDNQLTGPVPPSLASSPELKDATLSNNMLQGPFPLFPTHVTSIDVSNGNQFCHTDPGPCDDKVTALLSVAGGLGYPIELANSWKGDDPCAAWIGVTCNPQGDVTVINFASKHYSGTISPAFANLTTLTKIILSDNDLSGTIPGSLTTLTKLQTLDLTNNSLHGKVPDFPKTVSLKLQGNPSIGKDSDPGDSAGGGSPGSSSSTGTPGSSSAGGQSGGSKSSTGVIIGVVVALVVLVAAVVGCFLLHRRRKRLSSSSFGRVETQTPPDEQDMVKITVTEGVSHEETSGAQGELHTQGSVESRNTHVSVSDDQGMVIPLPALKKATGNFSRDNLLGSGGFGEVFRGEYNGTLIAVKRNISGVMNNKGKEEFRAEIDVLKKVRHRHLVNLLGYCMDDNEMLLVYEFMSEGTLGMHLFDRTETRYPVLNWSQRLTIALDVARGVEYLHSLAQESFIHRDLKPSNILLDKDLRAKVSDFGLVKLADSDKSVMTRLAGTFGYLAPEYALTGKVSTRVDVYAFGVILMELITGRKALDESLPDEETHLVTCFRRSILNKDFKKYVDPTLVLDQEASSSMWDVAELARHCTAREPNQRPDMGHAVNVLAPLVEKWKPTNIAEEDNYGDSSISLSQRLERWQYGESTLDLSNTYKGE